jgi:NAD(P)-dependent dehydrogenase (short-subunit alcohol dehydrogenase family)
VQIEGSGAIVFGGASGLGAATARRLAKEGASVVIADRAEDAAQAIAQEIGGRAIATDVTDPASVEAAVALATDTPGGLRIAAICAGIGAAGKLLSREGPNPLDTFTPAITINLIGTINALRVSSGAMVGNEVDAGGERGVCILTASVAAYDGQIGQIAYSASKGGVVAITLPAARELAPRAVRVATIAPGLFETPMLTGLPQAAQDALAGVVPHPSRLGRPDEYADLVEHVITNSMINGEVIRLDGALRMAAR